MHNHSNQYIWLLFYFISFISLILCLSCHTKFSAFNLQYIYIYIYILMFFLLFFTLIAPRSELPLIFKCFSTTYKLWGNFFFFFWSFKMSSIVIVQKTIKIVNVDNLDHGVHDLAFEGKVLNWYDNFNK